MPSIKLRDGTGGGGGRMAVASLSGELLLAAVSTAVEAAEKGHDVDFTINPDHIEVFVNAGTATE